MASNLDRNITDRAEMDDFDIVNQQLDRGGIDAACEALVDRLRCAERYHELFDALLVQCRNRLGLPLVVPTDLHDLPEPARTEMEAGTLAACRDVGKRMLEAGQLREAWVYLRPADEQAAMKSALEALEPDDETIDAMIEIAVHECVALGVGFQWLLESRGTCNAISTYEMMKPNYSHVDQQLVGGILVRWLHQEILENVRADAEVGEAVTLTDAVRQLLAHDPARFGPTISHVDVSHLASVVGFARVVEDPDTLRLALELAEYGGHLHETLNPRENAPFGSFYPSHTLFFAAQLGDRIDEAVATFRQEAQSVDVRAETTAAVEIYLVLLSRLGRFEEAIEAHATWLPPGVQTTGTAPSLMQLSQSAGKFETLARTSRDQGDLVGFALARMEAARRSLDS